MAGRGRLSSIDLLPEEAADDVLWACQELYARQRPIGDIHVDFNARLAAKGIDPISRTAFYNKSFRLAAAQRRMREAREMFAGLASEFTAENVDENTLILGEFIKTLIQELVDDAAGLKSPKEAMELARAYQSTVMAQKVSTDRRLKLEQEAKAKAVAAMEKAIGQAEHKGGQAFGEDVLKRIREEVYSIFEAPQ
jgi:dihydroorotase-like cyclic amidohydrolase